MKHLRLFIYGFCIFAFYLVYETQHPIAIQFFLLPIIFVCAESGQ